MSRSFRQNLIGGFSAAASAAGAAVLPLTGNPALADGAKATTSGQSSITNEQAIAITEKARDMRHYSENPQTQGIGIFTIFWRAGYPRRIPHQSVPRHGNGYYLLREGRAFQDQY